MIYLCFAAGLFVALVVGIMLEYAPMGREDADGFHYEARR